MDKEQNIGYQKTEEAEKHPLKKKTEIKYLIKFN
jgi:hypothetical protein